ncbi:MAG: DNA-binding transcriptional regulator Fis [Gammaproteobacteria bacterium]|nr:DNA-binding transcriptional regulator Fis [Gammaproteobacteria bacterium]
MKDKQQTNTLQQSVEQAIRTYLADLDGEIPCNLFDTVIAEIEQPMLQTVLQHCNHNQSKTATYLGINRGTLRKKLKQYQIDSIASDR